MHIDNEGKRRMRTQQNYKLGLIIMAGMLATACGDATPDGSATTEGTISVQVTASADGESLESDGVTAKQSITIDGMTTDKFQVAEFSYSWNGGDFRPIEVSESNRDFQIDLMLKEDKNTLVLRAIDTTEISDSISFELAYYQDIKPPKITVPTAETAALIFSEADMVAEVNPTNLVLTGGVGFPVIHDVTYSKYSTTYAEGNDNLPVWKFAAEDNYSEEDAISLEFRVVRPEGDVIVDWTNSVSGFDVVISSTLNPLLALETGDFLLEVRAVDVAGNTSDSIQQAWNQTILNPLLHLETALEGDMGASGGPSDPGTYVLDQNFSALRTAELHVGAIRIGNPNNVEVTAKLEGAMDPRATYSYQLGLDGINLDVTIPFEPFNECDADDTYTGQGIQGYECLDVNFSQLGLAQTTTRRQDGGNVEPTWEFRDLGGNLVGTGDTVRMPANTVLVAIARTVNFAANVPSSTETMRPSAGGSSGVVSMFYQQPFWHCSERETVQGFENCNQWNYELLWEGLLSVYMTWEFTAQIESKVGHGADAPFQDALPDAVIGYSRVLSTTSVSLGATPVSH